MSTPRLVVTLGSAQTLAWGSTYYLPGVLGDAMAQDLGVSTPWVFAAFSGALVVSAFVGPLAGKRIDARGGRGVLAASSLIFAGGLALLGFSSSLPMLCAAWLVLGVGMAMGLYDAAFSTLAWQLGRDARNAITGITLIAGFASTVCWPITAVLDAQLGWRGACFVWAAAHLVIGWPLNRFALPHRGRAPSPPAAAEPSSTAGPDRRMVLLAFVFAATWFISTAIAAHLPRLLQIGGLSLAAAIAVAGLVGPAQVAGRLIEFGLLRRHHPLLSARGAMLAHPLGALVLLALGAPAAWMFALLHGAGNGIMTIASGTLPLVMFGAAGYGFRQGMLMVPARFCQACAPLLAALLIERAGIHSLFVTAAIGAAGFAALLLLSTAPRRS